MVPDLRQRFNNAFQKEVYNKYLNELDALYPGSLVFRVAETPVFVPKKFKDQMIGCCEHIIDFMQQPGFMDKTNPAIPDAYRVGGDEGLPQFICFDFGICEDSNGGYIPQLIELQGFPSLFGYQYFQDLIIKNYFDIPGNFSSYFGEYSSEVYPELLKAIILDGHKPEEVVLLEIFPDEQKTRIDFYCTQALTGITILCYTNLKSEGRKLFYEKENGSRQHIKRIYNRLIFDDLQQQELPDDLVDLKLPYEVEWCPHPNWFYRLSKFTLPFIHSPYVPPTSFLNDVKRWPEDLENYVLKPLFSFAGQGVIIDVVKADLEKIEDPENWILQKKVQYADIIQTPDVPAKAEIRIFYFWLPGMLRPQPVQNLGRLSKGKMIGVRYNADKEWVGGTLNFFEK